MSAFQPYLPEDFDEFWAPLWQEAHDFRLDYHRSLTNDYNLPGFTVETLHFAVPGGRRLHGWIAYPPGARRYPGFLWIPPYGRESLLPNEFGTRQGFVSMSLNFFGHEAFHQEKYVKERGYFSTGAESPESWMFRQMFLDSMIAMRVLQAQVEVDESRLASIGMSQGAGLSIWLGAWCPLVKVICADMPFLSAVNHQLIHTVHRYPLKELTDFMEEIPVGQERVLNTVAYYDTMNMATRCKVPTQVSLGLRDPAARPDNVRSAYAALACDKKLIEYDWGHDWFPPMIENNRRWLVDHLGSP
jgi:cephalosporin-C deacetylase